MGKLVHWPLTFKLQSRFFLICLIGMETGISKYPDLACKDSAALPLDQIQLCLKAQPSKTIQEETTMMMPIIPPHLLTTFLVSKGRLKFTAAKTRQFWDHHRRQSTPLAMQGLPAGNALVEPFGLYSDEAEYTVSKEKILVILGSA